MALRLLGSLARVVLGFGLACLVAGIAIVLFVDTPAGLARLPGAEMPERAGSAAELALLAATHVAIFSAAFGAIALGLAEWLKIRTMPYYLATGAGIAMLGFLAQYQSEIAGQPTILNNYAIKAFLTAGFFSGLMYWLAAGQFAGAARMAGADERTRTTRPSGDAEARPRNGSAAARQAANRTAKPAAPVVAKPFQSLSGRLSKIVLRKQDASGMPASVPSAPAIHPATHPATSVPTTTAAGDAHAPGKDQTPQEVQSSSVTKTPGTQDIEDQNDNDGDAK